MSFSKNKRQETITYLVLWGLLFIAPVLSLYIRTASDASQEFNWDEVLMVWRQCAVFFAVFLIHNHLLAPMLVYRQKRLAYFGIVAVLIAVFTVYQCQKRPAEHRFEGHRPPMERHQRPDIPESMDFPEPPELPVPPERMESPRHPEHREPPRLHERPDHRPPLILSQHEIVAVIVLILMLGMNLGVKLYFKQRNDQRLMAELERKNLQQQLEYLRYQINPHFFMNTLNNIHALIDIDPEKAKDTILELSRMMRFVLYEGNKSRVPVDRELTFLQHYITLMKIRYTDRVRIDFSMPATMPAAEVPPLIFITFVENAFKHGVSYQHESFIEVGITAGDDRLRFTCRNSKAEKPNEEKGGVGLANVRKRLDLIYGSNYTLDIQDAANTYTVELNIPIT